LDLGDAPTFLEARSGLAIDTSNVFTLMGNGVQFPTASRRIRPYVVNFAMADGFIAGFGEVSVPLLAPGNSDSPGGH
jgi:hypothetical protein